MGKKGNKIVIKLGGIDASTFRIFIPKNSTYGDYAAIAEIEAYLGSSKIKYFDDRLKGLYFPIKNGIYLKEIQVIQMLLESIEADVMLGSIFFITMKTGNMIQSLLQRKLRFMRPMMEILCGQIGIISR